MGQERGWNGERFIKNRFAKASVCGPLAATNPLRSYRHVGGRSRPWGSAVWRYEFHDEEPLWIRVRKRLEIKERGTHAIVIHSYSDANKPWSPFEEQVAILEVEGGLSRAEAVRSVKQTKRD